MFALTSIALPALLFGSAASTVSFELRLRVPVVCAIESLSGSPDNPRVLRVSTRCNTENIDLSFSGDLANNRIAHVSSGSFVASRGVNTVRLRQFRPGRGEVEIVFDDEIKDFSSNSVSLAGY